MSRSFTGSLSPSDSGRHASAVSQVAQESLPGILERPPQRGLSSSDAIARAAAGLSNQDGSAIRTDGDVVRSNVVTFFNLVLALLIVALLAVPLSAPLFY